jgi:hypothetical protein
MLTTGKHYHDLGADYYDRLAPEHARHGKIKDLEIAGYTVTKAA